MRPNVGVAQPEPARAARIRSFGIDGDKFNIELSHIPKGVVSAHHVVFSPRRGWHAKFHGDSGLIYAEIEAANDDVVEFCCHAATKAHNFA